MDDPKNPPATTPQPATEYEFTEAQNTLLRPLAFRMGFISTVFGIVSLIGLVFLTYTWQRLGFDNPVAVRLVGPHIVTVLMFLLVSVWLARAGKAFRLVVTTKGHDITNIMNALNELRKLFGLIMWILIIVIITTGYFFWKFLPMLEQIKEKLLPN